MAQNEPQREQELEQLRKCLKADYSDYESTVIFVCSLEAWFRYRWGEGGHEQPGRLREFDRFPDCGGLTPDFVAYFTTPYVLCGEYKKTFHRLPEAREDVEQVVAYSRWRPPHGAAEPEPAYDVVLVVGTHSDDVAGEELAKAAQEDKRLTPESPVVIVGYMPDTERVNGDWYSLKWRKSNNSLFSSPNVLPDGEHEDLNDLVVKVDQCPIRRDRSAATISGRCPFVNDEPPPLYSAVRVLLPALSNLIQEEQRDKLQAGKRVPVTFSLDELLAAEILQNVTVPPKHIRAALEWLVEIGVADKVVKGRESVYSVVVDDRLINHAEEIFVDKAARDQLKDSEKHTQKRQRGKGQTRFW